MHVTATAELLNKLVMLTSRRNSIIHTWCQGMTATVKVKSAWMHTYGVYKAIYKCMPNVCTVAQ